MNNLDLRCVLAAEGIKPEEAFAYDIGSVDGNVAVQDQSCKHSDQLDWLFQAVSLQFLERGWE